MTNKGSEGGRVLVVFRGDRSPVDFAVGEGALVEGEAGKHGRAGRRIRRQEVEGATDGVDGFRKTGGVGEGGGLGVEERRVRGAIGPGGLDGAVGEFNGGVGGGGGPEGSGEDPCDVVEDVGTRIGISKFKEKGKSKGAEAGVPKVEV